MIPREQQRGDAFDEGAAAHLRGDERTEAETYASDDEDLARAWRAGWDASLFFGLMRDGASKGAR